MASVFGLSTRLKECRKKTRLSQKEAAARIGINKSSLGSYESGSSPSLLVLCKIAQAYGVTTDYLLGMDSRKSVNADGLRDFQLELVEETIDVLRRSNRE